MKTNDQFFLNMGHADISTMNEPPPELPCRTRKRYGLTGADRTVLPHRRERCRQFIAHHS